MKNALSKSHYLIPIFLVSISLTSLTACQKKPEQTSSNINNADTSSGLAGCYTITKTEPAQIKINEENGSYTMQMRQFNDPDKPWDKPEPLQNLANNEVKSYFSVDEKSVENAVIRPDKVFAIAKVQDSLMNLDSRFDSNYLGYIAKSETIKGNSTTIYKVKCESK